MKKFIVTILLFVLTPLFTVEIAPELGFSRFQYAEVGSNNKDDLYTITSFLGGLDIGFSNDNIGFDIVSSFQIPLDLKLSDALGSDDRNYLNYLIFFGGNFRGEIKYEIELGNGYYLYPMFLGNYDIFYFKDYVIGESDEYFYSVLGLGGGAQLSFVSKDNIVFNMKFFYTRNLWPMTPLREGEFIGSNNLGFTLGIGKKL